MSWTPVLFLPSPIHTSPFRFLLQGNSDNQISLLPFSDFHLKPHYPAKSPLEDVLGKVSPGTDEYVTEKYAFEIMHLLRDWSEGLKAVPPALSILANFLAA